MSFPIEYILVVVVVYCLWAEVVDDSLPRPMWQLELIRSLAGHRAWTSFINDGRANATLGGWRVENRAGNLYVVGLGQCYPVDNLAEGATLITRLKRQLADLVESASQIPSTPDLTLVV